MKRCVYELVCGSKSVDVCIVFCNLASCLFLNLGPSHFGLGVPTTTTVSIIMTHGCVGKIVVSSLQLLLVQANRPLFLSPFVRVCGPCDSICMSFLRNAVSDYSSGSSSPLAVIVRMSV